MSNNSFSIQVNKVFTIKNLSVNTITDSQRISPSKYIFRIFTRIVYSHYCRIIITNLSIMNNPLTTPSPVILASFQKFQNYCLYTAHINSDLSNAFIIFDSDIKMHRVSIDYAFRPQVGISYYRAVCVILCLLRIKRCIYAAALTADTYHFALECEKSIF